MGLIHPTLSRRRSAGFTLVEIMAVVLIILVLAGLILSMAGGAARDADIANTKALLERIGVGLEAYKAETGQYPVPSNIAEANRLLYRTLSNTAGTYNPTPIAGREPFMDWKPTELNPVEYYPWDTPNYKAQPTAGFVDAWGNAIQYTFDPNITSTYRLWSMGPDGKTGDVNYRVDDIAP